jgi:hypothetical protein
VANNCFTDFESLSHVPNLIGVDAQCVKFLPFLMLLLD